MFNFWSNVHDVCLTKLDTPDTITNLTSQITIHFDFYRYKYTPSILYAIHIFDCLKNQ
jgi:hypothetical protein